MSSNFLTEEFSQATTRFRVSMILALAVVAILLGNGEPLLSGYHYILPVILTHTLICYMILRWVKAEPFGTSIRIGLSVGTDILIATYALNTLGPYAAIVFPIYLWTSVGTGIRHGVGWLVGCSIASLICSSSIYLFSPFWQDNYIIAISLQCGVLLVAIFYRQVLGRTHAWQQKLKEDATASRQAADAKTMFLANMSHELRTPLNGIHGMAQILTDRLADEDNRKLVKILMRSSESLLHLINDILDYAKIDSGKIELESRDFDFQLMVEEMVALQANSAQEKGLELTLEIGAGVRYCKGDEVRLRQILLNLLGNAIKFTEKGNIKVCATSKLLEHSVLVQYDVIDTGIGISETEAERIFDQFQQADETTTRRFGGTGLGLAISKKLVDLMGGDLQMKSQPGKGAHFTVMVELKPGVEPEGMDFEKPIYDIRVLLAEDNKVNQMVAKRLLEKLGVSACVVDNGEAAVVEAQAQHYDAILMDLHMPVMSGRQAAAKLRFLGNETPIVALTADVMDISPDQESHVRFDAWIHKPCRLQDFISVFNQLGMQKLKSDATNSLIG